MGNLEARGRSPPPTMMTQVCTRRPTKGDRHLSFLDGWSPSNFLKLRAEPMLSLFLRIDRRGQPFAAQGYSEASVSQGALHHGITDGRGNGGIDL